MLGGVQQGWSDAGHLAPRPPLPKRPHGRRIPTREGKPGSPGWGPNPPGKAGFPQRLAERRSKLPEHLGGSGPGEFFTSLFGTAEAALSTSSTAVKQYLP